MSKRKTRTAAQKKADNAEFARQNKRIQELFEPVLDKLIEEGIDVIGAIYSINMDLVLRDVTLHVPAHRFDAVFNRHYDLTVDAIAEMIDKAYDLPNRIKAKRKAEAKRKAKAA